MPNHPYTQHTLANGLRVVIEPMPDVSSAAAGFLARTGSRDETPEMAGASHFLEHMCFKGSANRDWREISIGFDRLGSRYNAFTSCDRTFYYGWVPKEQIREQIELLADLVRPALPEAEFTTEKKVILEEIAMAKDSLDHVAFDFLLEKMFAGHPLAWPILGYESTLNPMTRDQLHAYFNYRYTSDRTVLVIAGNVDPVEMVELAEELCGSWKPSTSNGQRVPPTVRTGSAKRIVSRFTQQLVALAYPAPNATDPLHATAQAAMSILGGSNSRFFWNIVQEGISPHAGAYRFDMADCGVTILSGQNEPQRIEELTEALRREARAMSREKVAEKEVQRVKNKRRTALAVEGESPYYRLSQIMDDVDYRDAPRTVEQRLAEVDAVSQDSIAELFQRFPIDGDGLLISVGPRDWPDEAEHN